MAKTSGKDERERLAVLLQMHWEYGADLTVQEKADIIAALRERKPREEAKVGLLRWLEGLPEISDGFLWTVQRDLIEGGWAWGALNPKTGEHVLYSEIAAEPQPEREPDEFVTYGRPNRKTGKQMSLSVPKNMSQGEHQFWFRGTPPQDPEPDAQD